MTPTPPPQKLFEMAVFNWMAANAIQAVAYYGIADLLQDGPKSIAELAKATQTHAGSLYRVMRALSAAGIFEEKNTDVSDNEERVFAQTKLSHFLCQDVPGSMYGMVRLFGSELEHRSWKELPYSIRTGQPAPDHIFGMTYWDYLTKERPDEGAIFNKAMRSFSTLLHAALIESYDFSGIQKLMDVGGGDGTLLLAVLRAHPELQGVVFDLAEEATQSAKQSFTLAGMAERSEVFTGDFLRELPYVGADACILEHILHDWGDTSCTTILSNCRRILKPGNKLLIVEQLLPQSHPDFHIALLDLEMLVLSQGGRERTEQHYRTLIEQSGFALNQIVPTASPVSIIEAVAV